MIKETFDEVLMELGLRSTSVSRSKRDLFYEKWLKLKKMSNSFDIGRPDFSWLPYSSVCQNFDCRTDYCSIFPANSQPPHRFGHFQDISSFLSPIFPLKFIPNPDHNAVNQFCTVLPIIFLLKALATVVEGYRLSQWREFYKIGSNT